MDKTNLFVRNIAYKATSEDLQALFETVGPVKSAKIIFEKDSGRSKGFGFVEMETEELAQMAIEKLDGHLLLERPISIEIAKPRE